jgi:hypothetical protein
MREATILPEMVRTTRLAADDAARTAVTRVGQRRLPNDSTDSGIDHDVESNHPSPRLGRR